MDWFDQYSGDSYRVTTEGHHGGRGVAGVKTYGDVIEESNQLEEVEAGLLRASDGVYVAAKISERASSAASEALCLSHLVRPKARSPQLKTNPASVSRVGR